MPAPAWDMCHTLLEMALDALDERRPFEPTFDELATAVRAYAEYPKQRWKASGSMLGNELHQHLDWALRNNPDQREPFLERTRRMLACKRDHQDSLAGLAVELAAATRALAQAAPGGRLDADTADPLAAPHDALRQFHPGIAKTVLRELLRDDKYRFQRTDTRGERTLLVIAEYLHAPAFDDWKPSADLAVCGAVAQGHPNRHTWYLDGDADPDPDPAQPEPGA